MSNCIVNLNYDSPQNDFTNCIVYNTDGTTDIKCTLIMMRNKLEKNITVLNKLISHAEHIVDMGAIDDELLLMFDSEEIRIEMQNEEVVRTTIPDSDSDQVYYSEDEDEQIRKQYHAIGKLLNQNDTDDIFGVETTSESDSEMDEVISDIKNTDAMIQKYNALSSFRYDSNSSDNDSSDSNSSDSDI